MAFSIVGPIILVIISLVVVFLILSFIKFRCDRQQRRKEASLGQGQLLTSKARMLAYSLPYNVLDFRKRFSMDDWGTLPLPPSSGPTPAGDAAFLAGYGTGSPVGRSPRDPAEDHRWETAPPPGLEQLGVRALATGNGQPSAFETRFLELQPLGGNGLGDLHSPRHHRSPVYESKSKIKKLKKRSIRPFIMGEFQHRHSRFHADGEGDGEERDGNNTRGIMCISQQSFGRDSPTTSTFQMRLDPQ